MISGQQKKRLTGVGPAYLAWEASVLPMYYSRIMSIFYGEYKNFSITICILMRYRSVRSLRDIELNGNEILYYACRILL